MAKPVTEPLLKAVKARNPRTWIVVADGAHARILESDQPHSGVILALEADSPARQQASRLVSDRLPRGQESATSARHAIVPRMNPKKHETELFLARLATYLKGNTGRFDQLVLVAPSRVIGFLKSALPVAVTRKIGATHAKDLTWMPVAEVLERLGQIGRQVRRTRVQ